MKVVPVLSAVLAATFFGAVNCRSEVPAKADDLPQHIDFTLRNVRFQVLPDEVHEVFVGPDQKIWFEMDYPGPELDLARVRRVVEREFPKANPQVVDAQPVLFEPGGRLWLSAYGAAEKPSAPRPGVLLGYDGKTWIEYTLPKGRYLAADCPNHGHYVHVATNLAVDGCAMFIEGRGVSCFDGKKWTYQPFLADDKKDVGRITLTALSDGKTVVAGVTFHGLWRWRGGEWTAVKLPPEVEAATITGVDLWEDLGVWVSTETPSRPDPQDPKRKIPERVGFSFVPFEKFEKQTAVLLGQLGDANFEVREEATAVLIKFGAAPLREIQLALSKTDDPEVRKRLQKILEAIKPDAEKLHVMLPAGLEDGSPVAVKPGRLIWTSSGLVDSEQGKTVAGLPDGSFAALPCWDGSYKWVCAAMADGTAFLSQRHPSQIGGAGIIAWRAEAPDDRRFLDLKPLQLAGDASFVLAQDGSAWAVLAEDPAKLQRFDGRGWQALEYSLAAKAPDAGPKPQPVPDDGLFSAALPPLPRSFHWIASGAKGAMLFGAGTWFVLYQDGKFREEASLAALIAKYPKDVAGLLASAPASWDAHLAADNKGHIWWAGRREDGGQPLLEEDGHGGYEQCGGLSVLIGDKWVDGSKALEAAGAVNPEEVMGMATVAGGSKIYVATRLSDHKGGESYFAEVKEDKIVLAKAPSLYRIWGTGCDGSCLRSLDGDLWIPWSYWIKDQGQVQVATRVAKDGTVENLENSGWARFVDLSGNVWLGESLKGRPQDFNVWRDGKIASSVRIPSGEPESRQLMSDRPGSVYAWTKTGLYHLTADNPAEPLKFVVKACYHLRGVEGAVESVQCSPLEFLVIKSRRGVENPENVQFFLYVVPLPKD
jgi:hypothetical protein